MFKFNSCPKRYTQDLDKAVAPEETVIKVKGKLNKLKGSILSHTQRIDTGRLNIPVFLSFCGDKAREMIPGRKQMGKGSSEQQAEASALMELVERYSLFSFWQSPDNFVRTTWSDAQNLFKDKLLPLKQILHSVQEDLPAGKALEILDLVEWDFVSGLSLHDQRQYFLPVDWFRKLNEFNGSSSGNTREEAVLQGICELVERHVSAIIDQQQPTLPTLDPNSFSDPVLLRLWQNFSNEGIKLWLKDFTLNMGIPTVGALAYDPATFPSSSEIVFTAGTATSPDKAAIRALTEVAQLAGDFETNSNYEASGLSKFDDIEHCQWIKQGPLLALDQLPDISHQDFLQELNNVTHRLYQLGYNIYTVDITCPDLMIPAHYNIVPGFLFRERTEHACLGLFTGRILAEESPLDKAKSGLNALGRIYSGKHFLPFFQGILQLRMNHPERAKDYFTQAEPKQPSAEDQSLAAFYKAYALTQMHRWPEAVADLDRAINLSPDNHAYYNLRGVAFFKQNEYEKAAADFNQALCLNKGSAMDLANLGLCYKFMNKQKEALHCLQSSLELDSSLEFARRHLEEIRL